MLDSTMLMISYANLKEMLECMQQDGLDADGCSYDTHEDAKQYIQDEIEHRGITVLTNDVARKVAAVMQKLAEQNGGEQNAAV